MQKEVRLLALLRLSVQDSDPHGQRSSDNHLHDLLSVLRMSSLPPDLHTISHDLSVVKHISDRVGVMYLGSMMELADKNEIYSNPQHPYTRALIGAIPLPDPTKRKEMQVIQGEIPSNVNIPKGCKFNPRCPFAKDICREQEPATKEVKPNHFVKCHFGGEF